MATNGPKRPITRRREHLACIECRRKKLKCDRAAPCSACTRRDGGISCSYQKSTTGFEAERERRKRAEGRLEHLEQLVQQLSNSGQLVEPSLSAAEKGPASTVTPINGSSTQESRPADDEQTPGDAVYNGATHWSAMLEDIEELKSAISLPTSGFEPYSPSQDLDDSVTIEDSAILFGAGPTLNYEQVLRQYLPSRQEADRFIATYLRSKAVKSPFFHHTHFQRRYLAFWEDPSSAPVLWVSLMFSVFHAATTSLGVTVTPDNRYAVAAAHCLAIGKHYQPRQYAVEALVFYAQTKCFTQIDISPDIGSIFGLATRTAMRMGYHRDPGSLPLSLFEKEMRRRTWSTLLQLELLITFQLGQPSSILPGSWNTTTPSNLNDADFDEDTPVLPPSRPADEETDVTFYNAKHRLSIAFEQVHSHVSSTHHPTTSASDIDRLDALIHTTFLSLPQQYRAPPLSTSPFDSPTTIVARFCVNMIHAKCLCVLHRPYVAAGRRASVLACAQAAGDILRFFLDAYEEFQPGGQVELQKWFLSAITWHDFLLGAAGLCLVVCKVSEGGGVVGEVDVRGVVTLLGRARAVLEGHAGRSRDTARVLKVVGTVCERFEGLVVGTCASEMSAPVIQDTAASTVDGIGAMNLPSSTAAEANMDFDWMATASQPMVDESWNWLERFLQDDSTNFFNGDFSGPNGA